MDMFKNKKVFNPDYFRKGAAYLIVDGDNEERYVLLTAIHEEMLSFIYVPDEKIIWHSDSNIEHVDEKCQEWDIGIDEIMSGKYSLYPLIDSAKPNTDPV